MIDTYMDRADAMTPRVHTAASPPPEPSYARDKDLLLAIAYARVERHIQVETNYHKAWIRYDFEQLRRRYGIKEVPLGSK